MRLDDWRVAVLSVTERGRVGLHDHNSNFVPVLPTPLASSDTAAPRVVPQRDAGIVLAVVGDPLGPRAASCAMPRAWVVHARARWRLLVSPVAPFAIERRLRRPLFPDLQSASV